MIYYQIHFPTQSSFISMFCPYLVCTIFIGTLPEVIFALTETKVPIPTTNLFNSLILTKQDAVTMLKSSVLSICWYLKLMSFWFSCDTTVSLLSIVVTPIRFNLLILTGDLHCINFSYFEEQYPTIFSVF